MRIRKPLSGWKGKIHMTTKFFKNVQNDSYRAEVYSSLMNDYGEMEVDVSQYQGHISFSIDEHLGLKDKDIENELKEVLSNYIIEMNDLMGEVDENQFIYSYVPGLSDVNRNQRRAWLSFRIEKEIDR